MIEIGSITEWIQFLKVA